MKKSAIILAILLATVINSNCQWYVKEYNVKDIDFLSDKQLDESLTKSKQSLLFSGCITGAGGLFFVICKYAKPGMSEDPGFIEQLLGDDGVNKTGTYLGIGMMVGGAIASIVFAGRIGTIKSVIKNRYHSSGWLKISPSVILVSRTQIISPGFRLTYRF